MTNAAGFDLDAHFARTGLGDRPLNEFKRRIGRGNLGNAHHLLSSLWWR